MAELYPEELEAIDVYLDDDGEPEEPTSGAPHDGARERDPFERIPPELHGLN